MTRLEKAMELHTEMTASEIVRYCPEDQLPIDRVACQIPDDCLECWNKEYEEGEST
jgi:hypothetical protein